MSKQWFFRRRGLRKTAGGFGQRRLAVECLESRRVLDANIASIELLINDQSLVVNQSNDIVQVAFDDHLQVGKVDYEVTGDTVGFAAFEGYLRQGDAPNNVQFDYSDGRFGSADRNNPLAPGEFQHAGLNGEWVLEQYADRLSVALVRYSGGQATVEDRFYVKLQMGEPDLVIADPNSLSVFTVGNQAQIVGTWTNLGSGTIRGRGGKRRLAQPTN